jgi:hypothetical protein
MRVTTVIRCVAIRLSPPVSTPATTQTDVGWRQIQILSGVLPRRKPDGQPPLALKWLDTLKHDPSLMSPVFDTAVSHASGNVKPTV